MACHEIAALRLGLMRLLGRGDETERQHELQELGSAADDPGPIRALTESSDLASLKQFFEDAVSALEQQVSTRDAGDPKLPYLQTLVVLTRTIELDLDNQIDALDRLYRNLEDMHDFVHEIYPAPGGDR